MSTNSNIQETAVSSGHSRDVNSLTTVSNIQETGLAIDVNAVLSNLVESVAVENVAVESVAVENVAVESVAVENVAVESVNVLPPATIVMILDASGSMEHQRDSIITSVNKFIDDQKQAPADGAKFTIISFSDEVKTLFENLPIEQVPHISKENYVTDGNTALYDAVDIGITRHLDAKRVMMVIVTDGQENASKSITYNELQLKIEVRKLAGWNFIYLCNNIGVSNAGVNMGFTRSAPTATYSQSNNIAVGNNFGAAIDKCLSAAAQSFRGESKVCNLNEFSNVAPNTSGWCNLNVANQINNNFNQGPPIPVATESAVRNTGSLSSLSSSSSWAHVIRSGYDKLTSYLPSVPSMTHNTNDPLFMPPLIRQTNNYTVEPESKKETEPVNVNTTSNDPDDDIYDESM